MGTRRIAWRQAEEGRCGFCEQRHVLEIEYRCADCDRAVCALCIVTLRETREAYCPECRRARDAAPRRSGEGG